MTKEDSALFTTCTNGTHKRRSVSVSSVIKRCDAHRTTTRSPTTNEEMHKPGIRWFTIFRFFFNFLRFCPQPFFAWVIISINFCCLLWCVWCGLHGHGVQVLPIAIHQICSDTRQNSILSAVADKQLQWSARHHNHTEERVNGGKELAARRVKYKYDRYIFTCADNRRSFSFFFFVIIDAWKCRLPKCFLRKFITVAQWRNTASVINDRPFIMVRFNCGRVIDRSQHIETENYRLGDNQSSLCPVPARRENFTAV